MPTNKNPNHSGIPRKELKFILKLIGNLSRSAMIAGNRGDFETAFDNSNQALLLALELEKECLVAKLLNNIGILYCQSGAWDKALLSYEKAMDIVVQTYGEHNLLFKIIQKNLTCLLSDE